MSQTRRTAGASVRSTSRRLATSAVWRLEIPVTLPPGWASVFTMPAATGSPTRVKTIGTVPVAFFTACVATSWLVKITSTPAWTRARAAAGMASSLPSVKRMSNVTSRPSSRPSCRRPALSPSTVGWLAAYAALTTPTRDGRRGPSPIASGASAQIAIATASPTGHRSRPRRPGAGRTVSCSPRGSPRSSSPRDEPMVCTFGHVVPRAHERLELRERRVHLPRHGRLLRLLLHDVGRELPEIPQHRRGQLDELDLALPFRLEHLEGDRVLRVELREPVHVHGRDG